jgi:hypothetical protein
MVMTEAEEVTELIKRVVREPISNEFLHFLAWHPHTHFNSQALVQLLSRENATSAGEALNRLVASGLVKTRTLEGIPMYWLTQNEPAHNLVKAKFNSVNINECAIRPAE